MRAWTAYAAAAVAGMAVLAPLVGWLVGGERAGGVWVAAGIAAAVQLPAFAALVVARVKGRDFLVSWAGGMLLRFVAIAGAAFWVTRGTRLDPAVTLLSLVGFVFLLVLLEPAFLRLADAGPAETKTVEGRTSED